MLKLGNWKFNKGTICKGQDGDRDTQILSVFGAGSHGALTTLHQKRQVDSTCKRVAPALGKVAGRRYRYKETARPGDLVGKKSEGKRTQTDPHLTLLQQSDLFLVLLCHPNRKLGGIEDHWHSLYESASPSIEQDRRGQNVCLEWQMPGIQDRSLEWLW